MIAHFRRMAAYNCWANEELFEAVGKLSPAAFVAPRVGFFPSIAKTLNHLLLADTIWMGRLEGGGSAGISRLDQQLHDNFPSLQAARRDMDARLLAYVSALTEDDLPAIVRYVTMAGEAQSTELGQILEHVFNHQTHHRGQVHAMLSSTDVAPPALDLIFFLRRRSEIAKAV